MTREAKDDMQQALDAYWAAETPAEERAAYARMVDLGMPLELRIDRHVTALHRIASWSDAYPLEAFPEPDADYYAKAAEVLKANGMTLDRLSAAAMRHVITQVGTIAKEALKE